MKSVTIYTDMPTKLLEGISIMKKCSLCLLDKEDIYFARYKRCRECENECRRNRYKLSLCPHCQKSFRPGCRGRYKFCSVTCRFMNKIVLDRGSDCWLWKASIQKKKGGYGTFVPEEKKSGLAHRASFILFKGPIDPGKLILHSCHNTICVNPDHLRQGTQLDNTIDRKMAGRTTNHRNKTGF